MTYDVEIIRAAAAPMAASLSRVGQSEIPKALIAGLDKVYSTLRAEGMTGLGCNVAIYRGAGGGLVELQAGVETRRAVAPSAEVAPGETPAGAAARATHWGPYERLGDAHAAIRAWLAAKGLTSDLNWEVYGDWSDDPAGRRTDVCYLINEEAGA